MSDPQKIIVAGDWHGNTEWALHVIGQAKALLAGEQRLIILHLGDFGIWPGDEDYLFQVSAALGQADAKLYFVDGNHEDHERLADWLAKGLRAPIPADTNFIGERIFWLPRGHRWQWHGRTWLACGGGVSLDAVDRTEGLDWWPGEEITDAQEAAIIKDGPADVLVSHDCPAGVVHSFPDRPEWWARADVARSEQHEQRLQRIVDATRPAHILHGHLHRAYSRTCDFGYGPVEVTGLDRDRTQSVNWVVLDVKSMTWGPA